MQVPVFDGQLLFVGEWPKALSMLRRPHERQRSALPDLTRRCPRLADAKLHGVCHLEKIEIPSRKVAMRRARPETLSGSATECRRWAGGASSCHCSPSAPGAGSGSVFASGRPQGQVRRGCGPRHLVDRGKFLATACMRLISSRRRHAGSAQPPKARAPEKAKRSSKGWPGSSRAWVLGQASPVDVDQSKVL
jgi:hypothetical protein